MVNHFTPGGQKMEERLIMVLSLDEFNKYDDNQLSKDVLVRSSFRIGYLAISNPDTSFQFVGTTVKVDEEEKKVRIYVKIKTAAVDPSEYLK